MITQAQDYQLINPVGIIDGGILPARDVAAGGEAHALRAEDMSFALEAVLERDFTQIAHQLPSPSHVMRRSDMNSVWEHLRRCVYPTPSNPSGRAISRSETFQSISYTTTMNGPELKSHYPDSVLESCWTADISKHTLDCQFWRFFYFDLMRSDRLMMSSSSYDLALFTGSATYVDTSRNSYQISISDNRVFNLPAGGGNTARLRGIHYLYANGSDQRNSYGTSNEAMVCALPLPGLLSSVKLIVCYHLRVRGVTDNGYTSYYFTRSFACQVTATGCTVPSAAFLVGYDLVSEAESLGHYLPSTKDRAVTAHAYVEIYTGWVVADYNFRTEIRTLNWTWTP